MSQLEVFCSMGENMPLIVLQLKSVFEPGIVTVGFVGKVLVQDTALFHL